MESDYFRRKNSWSIDRIEDEMEDKVDHLRGIATSPGDVIENEIEIVTIRQRVVSKG